jgi:hypothetical protein
MHTTAMEQGSSWKSNSWSATQDILPILSNLPTTPCHLTLSDNTCSQHPVFSVQCDTVQYTLFSVQCDTVQYTLFSVQCDTVQCPVWYCSVHTV